MSKGHNPVAIANYFINLDKEQGGQGLTLMQLIKLSYIAHGFNLGAIGEPLSNEPVEAWQYGPVFPSIFKEFKSSDDVPEGPESPQVKFTKPIKKYSSNNNFSDEETELMDLVYDVYGGFDGWTLSMLTHKKGSPWQEVWFKGGGQKRIGAQIPNEVIQKYFKETIINKYT